MGVKKLADMLHLLPCTLLCVVPWCLLVSPVLLSMIGEADSVARAGSGLEIRISSLGLMWSVKILISDLVKSNHSSSLRALECFCYS